MRNAVWFTLALGLLPVVPVAAQSAPETFTATATLKTAAGASATAPVLITITRWTTDAERDTANAALKSGGSAALRKALAAMPEAGTIQIGDQKAPLRFAGVRTTGGGRLVTVVAAEPILHIGAGVPDAKPKTGYDLAFATFEVDAAGKGNAGDLAPAATLKVGTGDAIVVDDYGTEAVRLSGIAKK
jgi:hypothetical protein